MDLRRIVEDLYQMLRQRMPSIDETEKLHQRIDTLEASITSVQDSLDSFKSLPWYKKLRRDA